MSDLDFNLITEQDKEKISYGACVGGMTLTGMAVGRILGLQGLLVGAAAGAAYGLLSCKRLAPAIKQKLFSQHSKLNDHELVQALHAVREAKPGIAKSEAMKLLAAVRQEISSKPAHYRSIA